MLSHYFNLPLALLIGLWLLPAWSFTPAKDSSWVTTMSTGARASAQLRKTDPDTPKPDPDTTKPDPGNTKTDPDTGKPDPGNTKPDPDTGKPDPDTPKPDPDTPKPDPDTGKPDPGNTKPDPDTPKPDTGSSFTVNVNSSGASKVSISGSPSTYGGRTDYNVNQVSSGTSFTLTAPETSGSSSFSGWSGCASASGNVCSHTVTTDTTLTANYAVVAATFSLSVSSSGASKVSVSGSPATYGGRTDYAITKIPSGTSVTLTAPETSGNSSFSGWSGCGAASGNVCTHTITADTTITANYAVAGQALTLNVNSSGASKVSISASPSTFAGRTDYTVANIPSGTSFTLTAPEISGNSSFGGWSGCGSAAGNVCTHIIRADTTLAANYTNFAPTVPTGLTAAATGTKAIYLSWASSSDNLGVAGYKIYRDGTLLSSVNKATTYTDTGLAAATVYSYTVAACDSGGNCSAQSPPVSATTNAPAKPIVSTAEVLVGVNPNASINSDGALVIAPSADDRPPTVVLKIDATVNVDIKLPPGKPVIFSSNGATQEITDVSGQSQFSTTSKHGVTQVELVKGEMKVEVDKSGTSVSVTSSNSQSTGSLVTTMDKTSIAMVKDETKSLLFVDSGKIDYAAGQKSPVAIYQGEISTIDSGGNLVQLALGSQNGQKQLPGDPLAVEIPKDSLTKVPNLEGSLPRFDNTLSLLDIVGDAIKEATRDSSGKLSYEKTTGVISYALGTTTVRLIALGDILVQLNQFAATSISASASVAYSLASRGIEMSLAGALGYFSDLQSVVRAADSAGQLSLKPTGAIEIRMGDGHHVVMPGVTANLPGNPNPLPGFESDASGYAVFRDHLGALQTLYPTFLDPDSLNLAFAAGAPSLRVTNNGNGTVTAAVAGETLTLRPEYSVIDRPVGHETDSYWLDNGIIYFRNSDRSAQGFRLQ